MGADNTKKATLKTFVNTGSILVRITVCKFLSKRSIFYGTCKGTNSTDYLSK